MLGAPCINVGPGLNRENAAGRLVQNMFGRTADQLLQPVAVDSPHHDDIHLMLASEFGEHRDRLSKDEVPPIKIGRAHV